MQIEPTLLVREGVELPRVDRDTMTEILEPGVSINPEDELPDK